MKTPKQIVKEIIADLCDRSGLQDAFEGCDRDVQKEIRQAWEEIVRKGIAE